MVRFHSGALVRGFFPFPLLLYFSKPFRHKTQRKDNMNITQFRQELLALLQEKYGEDKPFVLKPVQKNNGSSYTGIICTSSKGASPAINTDAYFSAYSRGMTMDRIMDHIAESLDLNILDEDIVKKADDFNVYKDKLCIKLVNREMNKEFLKEHPYRPFWDLAKIVIYYDHNSEQNMSKTIVISSRLMEIWGITKRQLFDTAEKNSVKNMPVVFSPLSEFIPIPLPEDAPLYCLTNRSRTYGAACITYPGEAERIADALGSDYFLIPSSIHEILIFKGTTKDRDKYDTMIKEVNKEAVPADCVLGNHSYFYDREKKEFIY